MENSDVLRVEEYIDLTRSFRAMLVAGIVLKNIAS